MGSLSTFQLYEHKPYDAVDSKYHYIYQGLGQLRIVLYFLDLKLVCSLQQ
jgi:hypothetical protein